MKNILYIIFVVSFMLGCKKEEVPIIETSNGSTTKVEIPFEGKWERNFEAGSGNQQTVLYTIYQDSIRYTLTGQIASANYNITRDTFLLDNNRFIGHTSDDVYYLIFTKNVTNDSISIYKEIIPNFNAGISLSIPSDTATQNHGWGVYHKI